MENESSDPAQTPPSHDDVPPPAPQDLPPPAPVSTESANLPPATSTKEERYWSMGAHLATLVSGWVPFAGLIGPLVIWLIKKPESAYIERQSREALNFQISIAIYLFISTILFFIGIGFFTYGLAVLLNIVCSIIAAIKVSEGKPYSYPLSIRLVK